VASIISTVGIFTGASQYMTTFVKPPEGLPARNRDARNFWPVRDFILGNFFVPTYNRIAL
jgi:hypothetical protein